MMMKSGLEKNVFEMHPCALGKKILHRKEDFCQSYKFSKKNHHLCAFRGLKKNTLMINETLSQKFHPFHRVNNG